MSEEEKALKEKAGKDEKNLQVKFELAKLLFEKEKYELCIEECLRILKADKNWNNKTAYNLLLDTFKKLGEQNEAVANARKQLSKILFWFLISFS